MIPLNSFLKLTPSYRDYVWGGEKLRPGHYPTAEAWVVWEDDIIESGELAGKTLGEVAVQFGDVFLGAKAMSLTGTRFPLLIKLLDCAEWLSLQVHPNDQNQNEDVMLNDDRRILSLEKARVKIMTELVLV